MIYKASYESSHFSFDAYGKTMTEAVHVLRKTLRKHAEQCRIKKDWFLNESGGFEYNLSEVSVGCGYRDSSPIE